MPVALMVLLASGQAGAAQLTVSWTDSTGGTASTALERRLGTGTVFARIATLAPGATAYVDRSVTSGVTYCYRAFAYNTDGASPYSSQACGTARDSGLSMTVTRTGDGAGTVVSTPSGINCGSTCAATFPAGTTVTLTATAASGSVFMGWSGAGCAGTGSCTIAGNTAVNVSAAFSRAAPTPGSPLTLSVRRAGTGRGTVTSSPAGITCGTDCSESYPAGTTVTLTASPASGSTFGGWSGGGCSGTGTCRVTLTVATSVTATFTATSASTGGLTASFSYPASGASVRGTVSVGMATNKWGTAKTLTLSVGGRPLTATTITGTTLWYSWDTTTVANGARMLTLVVRDAAGSATATLPLNVANGTTVPPAPFSASFTYPGAGITTGGTQSIGMSTTAAWGVTKTFTLAVDGRVVTTHTTTGTTLWYYWDTRTVANGIRTLTVRVTSGGATATASRSLTVRN